MCSAADILPEQTGCTLNNGTNVPVGTDFFEGPCTRCICTQDGKECMAFQCPHIGCSADRELVTRPGECCPTCGPRKRNSFHILMYWHYGMHDTRQYCIYSVLSIVVLVLAHKSAVTSCQVVPYCIYCMYSIAIDIIMSVLSYSAVRACTYRCPWTISRAILSTASISWIFYLEHNPFTPDIARYI